MFPCFLCATLGFFVNGNEYSKIFEQIDYSLEI